MAYIYPVQKKDKTDYRVYYLFHSKKVYIGLYPSLTLAKQAYAFAEELLQSCWGIEDLKEAKISFLKCVSLINLRDHNMYLTSPIYVHDNYFDYYLSTELKLIFDLQDLFFFSTNKIHKRGNYIYIENSVSQTSILNRFHIPPNSVYNVDYYLINGNRYDFRRKNICVINHYIGVSREIKYKEEVYVARIIQKVPLVIGHYNSELKAAIAYNKAAELIMSKDSSKYYKLNQIDYLTSTEYNAIYEALPISPRLTSTTKQKRVLSHKVYRGICKDKGSFRASIGFKNKQIYLGSYPTEKRAAQAYNFASFYLYGNQGYVNDISPLIYAPDEHYIAEKLKKAYGLKS